LDPYGVISHEATKLIKALLTPRATDEATAAYEVIRDAQHESGSQIQCFGQQRGKTLLLAGAQLTGQGFDPVTDRRRHLG